MGWERILEASSAVASASAWSSRRVSVRRAGRASAPVAPIVAVTVPVAIAVAVTTTAAAVAVSVSIPVSITVSISVTVAVSTLVTIVAATSIASIAIAPIAFVLSPRVEGGRAHIAAIATIAPAVMEAIAPPSAHT